MSVTKEKILNISLNLFSQKGFSAVSIRDICKQVRIKESSVYYHFKNKQAIFDELLFRFQKIAMEMMAQLNKELATGFSVSNENFYSQISNCFFEKYLMDDFCNKVMRLLLIEQLCNPEIQKIYEKWMFKEPLTFQSKVFSSLMKLGVIKKADSDYLAVKYYSPIFFAASRWLFSGDLAEDRKSFFRTDVFMYIQAFFAELEEV